MASPRPRWLRVLRATALTFAGTYLVVVAAAFAFQRALIYQPESLPAGTRVDAGVGAEVVRFRASGGPLVSALWAPPRDASSPAVLVLHGNDGNLLTWSDTLTRWVESGAGCLLLDPRGYGLSEGSPTEEGILADAEAAFAFLAARGVAADRVVLEGISIGCGTALPLAAAHPVRGLVLQSPFTRLVDAASERFPFLPCSWLLKDRYDNLAAAPRVACPVLVLHGDADEIVPLAQGRRLAAAFPRPATLCVAAGFHHNDLAFWPPYGPTLDRFLRSLH